MHLFSGKTLYPWINWYYSKLKIGDDDYCCSQTRVVFTSRLLFAGIKFLCLWYRLYDTNLHINFPSFNLSLKLVSFNLSLKLSSLYIYNWSRHSAVIFDKVLCLGNRLFSNRFEQPCEGSFEIYILVKRYAVNEQPLVGPINLRHCRSYYHLNMLVPSKLLVNWWVVNSNDQPIKGFIVLNPPIRTFYLDILYENF